MSLRFQVADLSAIETRVAAWLSNCEGLSRVFALGRDPYIDLAAKMYGMTYDQLWDDYTGKNGKERKAEAKRKRQVAKPGILGAVYRLSGGGWGISKDGDKIKTGLFGYADAMGVEMSMEQSAEVVRIFRESYPEIGDSKVGIWKQLELAVADVMDSKRQSTIRRLGPNGCIVIDRVNIEDRHPMMRMKLPSGRYLHYLDARLEPKMMPWKSVDDDGNDVDVYRDSLLYGGQDQKTKQWNANIATHGGKLFENLVQAIARDILGYFMLLMEEQDMGICGHVHDEAISLVEDDLLSPTYQDMVSIMSQEVWWCPGLLLGADGHQGPYYRK